ncbi:hypothetical protein [Mesorhizobium sp. LjNodule214]
MKEAKRDGDFFSAVIIGILLADGIGRLWRHGPWMRGLASR